MNNPNAQLEGQLRALLELADPAHDGGIEEAARSARQAYELATSLCLDREAQRAQAWLARHLVHLGQLGEALAVSRRLLTALGPQGALPERVECLRITALAASELMDFDVALEAAEQLSHVAGDLDDAGVALNAAMAMGVCFERMGNSWQAIRLLSNALERHGADGPTGPVLSVANALAAVCTGAAHLLRESDDEERLQMLAVGRQAAERGLALLSGPAQTVQRSILETNLAEVLLASGEPQQAHDLLVRTQARAAEQGMAHIKTYAQTLLSEALLALGRPDEALVTARAALADIETDLPYSFRGRVHEATYRATKACGLWQEALLHMERAEALERRQLVQNIRHQSRIMVSRSEVEQARGKADRARREAAEHRDAAERMEQFAFTDALTGLGNRRRLEHAMTQAMPALQADRAALVVAQLDVDHFKRVNDQHGHLAGDTVLVALAEVLRKQTRQGDLAIRQGGEEFVLVLPNTTLQQATEICERLRKTVQALAVPLTGGVEIAVTISIGLAAAPPYDLALLLNRADEALYAAKRGGRNRVEAHGQGPD